MKIWTESPGCGTCTWGYKHHHRWLCWRRDDFFISEETSLSYQLSILHSQERKKKYAAYPLHGCWLQDYILQSIKPLLPTFGERILKQFLYLHLSMTHITIIGVGVWKELMSKNKLKFIHGSIKILEQDDITYEVWEICNIMILSWIKRTLKP